ncbi:AAA family ATPase [Nannocystis sp. ILAH1]|uniref:ParA family protein n=1 Tax=Nannocystis sp. ILAH1 TaxID=2996789 RepID=UPI00226DE872|nr:AAA family ATPase [Nannocystis sp. ILAH1]MCY0994776.1 AAA family ATPase [Nannocystis sp. ILAH1]
MATYAIWNNKGGVGKSYLTFQISCEYARQHPDKNVLVLDVCPQANSSSMLLGGMVKGEKELDVLGTSNPRRTIAGYVRDRINSPYHNPGGGAKYLLAPSASNKATPKNLYIVPGDGELEVIASRVSHATSPGPDDAWIKVHRWFSDLIGDVREKWDQSQITTFIDCNPSFGIYTELALTAADRLIIPFSADGSSKRAVATVLALLYGHVRSGGMQSEFFLNSQRFRSTLPRIYCYIGNRMTQANHASAKAFRAVVNEIGNAIWDAWQLSPSNFAVHPTGAPPPANRKAFQQMFQYEIVDANSASVVSSTLGIPIIGLKPKYYQIPGERVPVNESQIAKQQPNIANLVKMIE